MHNMQFHSRCKVKYAKEYAKGLECAEYASNMQVLLIFLCIVCNMQNKQNNVQNMQNT